MLKIIISAHRDSYNERPKILSTLTIAQKRSNVRNTEYKQSVFGFDRYVYLVRASAENDISHY